MNSRFKIAGHPVHPMLVVFPLGLLAISVVFDIIWYATDDAQYAGIGFYMVAAGLIGAVLAALSGTVDALSIPSETRARRLVVFHGGGNLIVAGLFLASWLLRLDSDDHRPTGVSLTLAIIATLLAVVTAWLGGELVYRLGVGVDDGAHVDAPSSLRSDQAREIDLRPGTTEPQPRGVADRTGRQVPRR